VALSESTVVSDARTALAWVTDKLGDKAKVSGEFVSDARTALAWVTDKLGDKAKVREGICERCQNSFSRYGLQTSWGIKQR
jgi:hypothetical protein